MVIKAEAKSYDLPNVTDMIGCANLAMDKIRLYSFTSQFKNSPLPPFTQ